MSEIKQSPVALLIILRIFAHLMSRRGLDLLGFDLLILNFYSTSDVQNLSEIEFRTF